MQHFDALVVEGVADQGDIQNGKGDYLNDVLALLLERCSGKSPTPGPTFPACGSAAICSTLHIPRRAPSP